MKLPQQLPAILTVVCVLGGVFAILAIRPDRLNDDRKNWILPKDGESRAASAPANPPLPPEAIARIPRREAGEGMPAHSNGASSTIRPSVDTPHRRIGALRNDEEAAEVHHALTRELLTCLEDLAGSRNADEIRVAAQELADRFYLLDRVATVYQLTPLGPASVTSADRPRIEALQEIWSRNVELSLTVDELFRQRGLLHDEHVPGMLMKWLAAGSPLVATSKSPSNPAEEKHSIYRAEPPFSWTDKAR